MRDREAGAFCLVLLRRCFVLHSAVRPWVLQPFCLALVTRKDPTCPHHRGQSLIPRRHFGGCPPIRFYMFCLELVKDVQFS